ncbi:unannotated protein [freshwater metagenome]|uniref:Unannotated protein n=1 Tax=freshwater metagenome TaxID=449393 RepID=A0A6J7NQL2_9ZZZZ
MNLLEFQIGASAAWAGIMVAPIPINTASDAAATFFKRFNSRSIQKPYSDLL